MAPRQIAEAIVQNVPKTAMIENVSTPSSSLFASISFISHA